MNRCEEIVKAIYKDLIQYSELPYEQAIILVNFRKILEKADAINVLIENKCGKVTDSFARDILESYWQFCYLLEEDTGFRTLSYYYFDKLNRAESVIKDIEYKVRLNKSFEHLTNETKKNCEDMIDYLTTDDLFREIREEIAKKHTKYVKWYSLKNKNDSLYKLAEHLNKDDEYKSSYSLFSGDVHGINGTRHIEIENDSTVIKPLRSIDEGKGAQMFAQYYLSLSIEMLCRYFELHEEFKKLKREMTLMLLAKD